MGEWKRAGKSNSGPKGETKRKKRQRAGRDKEIGREGEKERERGR